MRYTRLTYEQRLSIEQGFRSGTSQSAIARRIGVHRSTVCNELRRNGNGEYYSARLAQRKAEKNSVRNNAMYRRRAYRFPLDRGGVYSREESGFFKNRFRKWRFRKYKQKVRRGQQCYEYKMRWMALQRRLRYLSRRRRNHVMEGLSRARRNLSVFQSYRKGWRYGVERGMCSVRYMRQYTLSHEGIIKLHYRDRGITTEENDCRSPWRGHIRYEFQNPVRRRPWKAGVNDSCNVSAPERSPNFNDPINRAWNRQPILCRLTFKHGECFDHYAALLSIGGPEKQENCAVQMKSPVELRNSVSQQG